MRRRRRVTASTPEGPAVTGRRGRRQDGSETVWMGRRAIGGGHARITKGHIAGLQLEIGHSCARAFRHHPTLLRLGLPRPASGNDRKGATLAVWRRLEHRQLSAESRHRSAINIRTEPDPRSAQSPLGIARDGMASIRA